MVVSQDFNYFQLGTAPSQNRTCAVNASGSPRWPSRCNEDIDLQVGSVSIVSAAQCPHDALPKCLHRSAAFPPPELPGFIGTMQPSDFPGPFALLASSACICILAASGWSPRRARAAGISLVASLTFRVTRMGLRPRVSDHHSP